MTSFCFSAASSMPCRQMQPTAMPTTNAKWIDARLMFTKPRYVGAIGSLKIAKGTSLRIVNRRPNSSITDGPWAIWKAIATDKSIPGRFESIGCQVEETSLPCHRKVVPVLVCGVATLTLITSGQPVPGMAALGPGRNRAARVSNAATFETRIRTRSEIEVRISKM